MRESFTNGGGSHIKKLSKNSERKILQDAVEMNYIRIAHCDFLLNIKKGFRNANRAN